MATCVCGRTLTAAGQCPGCGGLVGADGGDSSACSCPRGTDAPPPIRQRPPPSGRGQSPR